VPSNHESYFLQVIYYVVNIKHEKYIRQKMELSYSPFTGATLCYWMTCSGSKLEEAHLSFCRSYTRLMGGSRVAVEIQRRYAHPIAALQELHSVNERKG